MTKEKEINIPTAITFPIKPEHIRKISDPTGDLNTYFVFCPVESVLDIPVEETNPRDQNLNSKVGKAIKSSLLEMDGNFHRLNRGITISAESSYYDNKTEELTIKLTDPIVHGNVDGGHTQRVILNATSDENWDEIAKKKKEIGIFKQQYVRYEIITGLNPDLLVQIAEARNTSVQVKDYSLENLKGQFEWLKGQFKDYNDVIGYKENDRKPVNVRDVIAILSIFNIKLFPNNDLKFPTQAYSSKAKPLEWFAEQQELYHSLEPIAVDILQLYDYIRASMQEVYNDGGGKFARWSLVDQKSKTKFYFDKDLEEVNYKVPDGVIYPLLGSFRFLVRESKGKFVWKVDDVRKFFDKFGENLIRTAFETVRMRGNNPNAAGKDSTFWEQLYNQVKLAYFELRELDENQLVNVE